MRNGFSAKEWKVKSMIVFRADGNKYIGAGHIMRCLSIAGQAALHGMESCFVTAGEEFYDIIALKEGHQNIVLHTQYDQMERELARLFSVFKKLDAAGPDARSGIEAVVVDSYQVSARYLNSLFSFCRDRGAKLIYIDDLCAFPYPCDVLVNYNVYGPDCDYASIYQNSDASPLTLLGAGYAPLRGEFQNLIPRKVESQGRKILISTGGADFMHIGIGILREILKRGEKLAGFQFHFIVGAMNEDAGEMHNLVQRSDHTGAKIRLHENVSNMAELMRMADVSVSAAGSTLYELCAVGTPALTYVLADNQIPGAKGFCQYAGLENVGDVRRLGVLKLSGLLVDSAVGLCKDYEKRKRIAAQMSKVVDAKGAERILEAVFGSSW